MQTLTVTAVDRIDELALLSDNTIVPITKWSDDLGERCEPRFAVAAVAGPTAEGKWLSVDLSTFNTVRTQ